MAFTPGTEQETTLAVRVQSEGVDEFTGAMDSATASLGKFRAAVGVAGAALGALSVGGLAAATKAAADFEEAMVEVEKVTSETTAARLNGEIREMAETIPLAQQELASLTADAARFGIEGTENIRAFSESVARMSVATNLSSEEAGESLARLGTLTETPAAQIENLGASINALSNNFATSASELVDSMLRSSAALTQFGLSRTEIIGLSASLNEVSESSERAGTRLRRVGQELMDPRKVGEIAEALGMTQAEFERMRDQRPGRLIVQMAEAFREGGASADALRRTLSTASRQAIAGLGQNLDATREAMELANAEFREGTSLQEEFAAATDTFNSELQLTLNRLRNIGITTGNTVLPVLSDLLDTVNAGLEDFQQLNQETEGMAGQLVLATGTAVGLGAALTWLAGGPIAAAAAASGALALAWTSNFADIQGVVERTMSSIADIVGRHLPALTELMQSSVDDQLGSWERFEVRVAQGLDTVTTRWLTLLDAFVTGGGIIGDVLGDAVRALDAALSGQKERAADIVSESLGQQREKVGAFLSRREERLRGLRLRRADRQGAIATGDASLLPSATGDQDEPAAPAEGGTGGPGSAAAAQQQFPQQERAALEAAAQRQQQFANAQERVTEFFDQSVGQFRDGVRRFDRAQRQGRGRRPLDELRATGAERRARLRAQARERLGRPGVERARQEAGRIADLQQRVTKAARAALKDSVAKDILAGDFSRAGALAGEGATAATVDLAPAAKQTVQDAVASGTRQALTQVGRETPSVDVTVRHALPSGDSVLEEFIRETVSAEVSSSEGATVRRIERLQARS